MASSSLRRLEDKVVIITGAASGIGATSAKLFVQHGAKVIIADTQDTLGHKVAEDLGSSVTFIHCDVTNENDIKLVVDTAISKYGKLDIMFNNAGIYGPSTTKILEYEQSDFERVLRVDLVGYFLGIKHAARAMIPNKKGSIILTASIASVIAGNTNHAYTSAKFGVLGLTKNTAAELGNYGIRVNCVSPFIVDTPMARGHNAYATEDEISKQWIYLNGRRLTQEDIAYAALYLASDESNYVNGHNLVVDGGFTNVNQGASVYNPSKEGRIND